MKFLSILCSVLLALFLLSSQHVSFAAECFYDGTWDVKGAVSGCLKTNTNLVGTEKTGDLKLTWDGFKAIIKNWVKVIGGILGILAVWGIVYGSFLMVVSQWDEEKFSKAKEIIKWSLIWFLALVSASALIAAVVSIVFGL